MHNNAADRYFAALGELERLFPNPYDGYLHPHHVSDKRDFWWKFVEEDDFYHRPAVFLRTDESAPWLKLQTYGAPTEAPFGPLVGVYLSGQCTLMLLSKDRRHV